MSYCLYEILKYFKNLLINITKVYSSAIAMSTHAKVRSRSREIQTIDEIDYNRTKIYFSI